MFCPLDSLRVYFMNTRLYVANLAPEVTETELKELFVPFGTVISANIATDRTTNTSRGFGFVEMGTDEETQAAITGNHGKSLHGKDITVNVSTPKVKGAPAVAK